jgi:Mrr N-terminal domain
MAKKKINVLTPGKIEPIMLTTLLERGGEGIPTDIYIAVEEAFPGLSKTETKNLPYNVRWVRKNLVARGLISDAERGVWKLTAAGRKEARTLPTATKK